LFVPVPTVSVQWKPCIQLGFSDQLDARHLTGRCTVVDACWTALNMLAQRKDLENPKLYKYW